MIGVLTLVWYCGRRSCRRAYKTEPSTAIIGWQRCMCESPILALRPTRVYR